MKKNKAIFFFFINALAFYSCIEVAKTISNWTQIESVDYIEGKYHFLNEDVIKIYLPKSFERYSYNDYSKLLDTVVKDNEALKIERKRHKHMRELKGNYYIFFDDTVYATYTLNTIPYTPLNRQDAKYILGIIRQQQRLTEAQTNNTYTKITAKHNDNGKTQVFRAIFRIENPEIQEHFYQHAYIISSNKKTVFINLLAPFESNFNPFIEKMIL